MNIFVLVVLVVLFRVVLKFGYDALVRYIQRKEAEEVRNIIKKVLE